MPTQEECNMCRKKTSNLVAWFCAITLALAGVFVFVSDIPAPPVVHAQQLPNCFLNGSLTATGQSATFDNTASGSQCNTWVLTVFVSSGVSALSVQLEGAGPGASPSWSAVTATSGTSNPCTSATGCVIVAQVMFNQFRVNLTSLTGSGTVSFRLQGASGITAKNLTSPVSGAAGGDLSGTYPNPTVAKVNSTAIPTNAAADQLIGTTAPAVGSWFTIPSCSAASSALTYNTSTHALGCNTIASGVTPQFSQTNSVTVTTTVAETTLVGTGSGSATLPANFFSGAGSILRIHSQFVYTGTANATVFKLKLGGTQILASAITPAAANYTCVMDIIITARTVGISGSVFSNGEADCPSTSGGTTADIPFNVGSAVTKDTTGAMAFDFTVTPGATSQSFTQTNLVLTNY